MRVTVLGCRAGMPADGEASSGYLVQLDLPDPTATGTALLLDCGPGVATVLSGVVPAVVPDAVVITHRHLDHCYDLLPLGKSLLTAGLGRGVMGTDSVRGAGGEPVPLLVPAGTADVLHRLAALFPVSTVPVLDRAFELAFSVQEYLPGTRWELAGATVSLTELRHASPNCGVRVEADGVVLAYTGDTGVTPALVELAAGADLLLAEATLPETDTGPHGHLSAADAGRVAAAAGVGELVLTHFAATDPAWLRRCVDQAAAEFDGPVRLARPRHTFPVGATIGSRA